MKTRDGVYMKKLAIIFLLLLLTNYLLSADLEGDKVAHFTTLLASHILTSYISEWISLPAITPYLVGVTISFGKELNDPFFSWADICYDFGGIGVGIVIMFADRKQR